MRARIIDAKTSVDETIYLRDLEYEDGTGQGLAQEILNEALRGEITPSNIIGFGADGASVMIGEKKRVKGRLKEQNHTWYISTAWQTGWLFAQVKQ